MIRAMLSSTVKDLLPDRKVINSFLEGTKIVESVGVVPVISGSKNSSPYLSTMKMAEDCDLYILMLGGRYGYETEHNKSATELEFDAAYKTDPTKILVFKRTGVPIERKQTQFIKRVSEYHKGYYISRYKDLIDLKRICKISFQQWIEERSAIGKELNYFDHFVRLAIQRSPFPNVHPTYLVSENHIEFKYKIAGRLLSIHFDKTHLYSDFWGSVSHLDKTFEQWRQNKYEKS